MPFMDRSMTIIISLLILMVVLSIHCYVSLPTSKYVVSYDSLREMTHPQHGFWRIRGVWSCHVAPGKGLHMSERHGQRYFNMVNPNWLHTSRSGWINKDWWRMNARRCIRKQFLQWIDHWMKPVGAHIAEITAEMLAAWQSRSNSKALPGSGNLSSWFKGFFRINYFFFRNLRSFSFILVIWDSLKFSNLDF